MKMQLLLLGLLNLATGTAQSLPYHYGFEQSLENAGWSRNLDAQGGSNWEIYTVAAIPPAEGDTYVMHIFATDTLNANWLYSAGFALDAGKSYRISWKQAVLDSDLNEKLVVFAATQKNPNSMNMGTLLYQSNHIHNTSWQEITAVFTPDTSGTYYLGFDSQSAEGSTILAIDDFSMDVTLAGGHEIPKQQELKFYVTADALHITSATGKPLSGAVIYDLTGKETNSSANGNTDTIVLPLAGKTTGLYLAVVEAADGTFFKSPFYYNYQQ